MGFTSAASGLQPTVLWAPKGDVPGDEPGDVRHFGFLRPPCFDPCCFKKLMVSFARPETLHPPFLTAVLGRNRWCRLPARKPSAAAGFCLYAHLRVCKAAGGLHLGTCQATVLRAPEGDVPGDVRRPEHCVLALKTSRDWVADGFRNCFELHAHCTWRTEAARCHYQPLLEQNHLPRC